MYDQFLFYVTALIESRDEAYHSMEEVLKTVNHIFAFDKENPNNK